MTQKVTTPEVIDRLSVQTNGYKTDIRELIDHLCVLIADTLAAGNAIQLANLGVFSVAKGKLNFRPADSLTRRLINDKE